MRHRGAVAIVPITNDGLGVLLVRQFRTPLNDWLLELPAGLRDKEGESDVDTARRELEEEVGCIADTMEHLVTLTASVLMSPSLFIGQRPFMDRATSRRR